MSKVQTIILSGTVDMPSCQRHRKSVCESEINKEINLQFQLTLLSTYHEKGMDEIMVEYGYNWWIIDYFHIKTDIGT